MPRSQVYMLDKCVGVGFESRKEAEAYFHNSTANMIDGTWINEWPVSEEHGSNGKLPHSLWDLDTLHPGLNCTAIVFIPLEAQDAFDQHIQHTTGVRPSFDQKYLEGNFTRRQWLKFASP